MNVTITLDDSVDLGTAIDELRKRGLVNVGSQLYTKTIVGEVATYADAASLYLTNGVKDVFVNDSVHVPSIQQLRSFKAEGDKPLA
jgi:hypothetical protein